MRLENVPLEREKQLRFRQGYPRKLPKGYEKGRVFANEAERAHLRVCMWHKVKPARISLVSAKICVRPRRLIVWRRGDFLVN